ncbi:MAG: GMC family oxidoreductase [Gammaproteobacteria bacterium]
MTNTTSAETIVIGGGSAGCVIAGRFAAAQKEVLLIEAGPDYGAFGASTWPQELVNARMLATTHDWQYTGGRWEFQRAKVIGGCSAHNGAIAAVGHRQDYDSWQLPGWSGNDVAPLFDEVIQKMQVRTYQRHETGPFHARCLQAAEALGWNMADDLCDLDANDAFGLETVNIVDTMRWNTAFAYLDPERANPQLKIIDQTVVDRISNHGNAVIVSAIRDGAEVIFECERLILAAGVYGTPQILQRSGVGDPVLLSKLNIDVVADSAGVGKNLHDHPMCHADRKVGAGLQSWLDEAAASGFLPEEQTLGKAISSQSNDGLYDLHVFPVCASDQTSFLHGRVHIEVACMTPQSRGQISITNKDPMAHPEIDHGYLSDPNDHDIKVMADGLKMAEEMLDHPLLAEILGEPISDTSSWEAIRAQVEHYYHPVGTCRMGTDAAAVCDPEGTVRGMQNVFVADASLMPQIPRGNTNLPAIMVGERIAQSLLGI